MLNLKLAYWTKRRDSITTIRLDATPEGWYFNAQAHTGKTDPQGVPFLVGNLTQDNVGYPAGLNADMAYLWGLIRNKEIDHDQAQQMLDDLGEWISATERARPEWKGWNC